jgi:hypothetical protein
MPDARIRAAEPPARDPIELASGQVGARDARDHPPDVRVDTDDGGAEGDRGDRRRGVRPDPVERSQRLDV